VIIYCKSYRRLDQRKCSRGEDFIYAASALFNVLEKLKTMRCLRDFPCPVPFFLSSSCVLEFLKAEEALNTRLGLGTSH
jgi:hypothetical protein